MVKLGQVAIDSTRIAGNASKDKVDSEQALCDKVANEFTLATLAYNITRLYAMRPA